jgi:hypothetical protein
MRKQEDHVGVRRILLILVCCLSACADEPTEELKGCTCDTPPKARCSGGVLTTYSAPGVCEQGGCRYRAVNTPCPAGCNDTGDACLGCNDACDPVGTTRCQGGSYQTCQVESDGCRTWSPFKACPSAACASPHKCAPEKTPGCKDACPSVGATRCQGGALATCEKSDDGCLAWGAAAPCPGGACASATQCGGCVHECPTPKATSCSAGELRVCETDDAGCRKWSSPMPCLGGLCGDATSCKVCAHECQSPGAVSCSQGVFTECQVGGAGCREWTAPKPCPDGFCQSTTQCGVCNHACSTGETKCVVGKIHACQKDANGCRQWGAPQSCPDGFCADAKTCGTCKHACQKPGDTKTAGGVTYVCEADANGCRLWIAKLSPIPGPLAGTTAKRDFHAEEDPPLSFPFTYGVPPFPRSLAVTAAAGATTTLPAKTSSDGYRSVELKGVSTGSDVEICAEAPQGKAKLWVYRTKVRWNINCTASQCHDPYELDETPQQVGKVCTRGRLSGGGPYYVVVETAPAATPATVTIKNVKIAWPQATDGGLFLACGGKALTTSDLAGYTSGVSGISSTSVGSYVTDGRVRTCSRFRGCTAWQPHNASKVSFYGTCSSCIPKVWGDTADTGSIWVISGSSNKHALALWPNQQKAAWTQNHVECFIGSSSCFAAGNWTNYAALEGRKLSFTKEREMTHSCFRTIAESWRNEFDSSQHEDTSKFDSLYREYEVVFKGKVTIP